MKVSFTRASRSSCDNAGVRLLMVEDDASLAAVLLRALVDEGYSVDVAARAVEAGTFAIGDYASRARSGAPDGTGSRCAVKPARSDCWPAPGVDCARRL